MYTDANTAFFLLLLYYYYIMYCIIIHFLSCIQTFYFWLALIRCVMKEGVKLQTTVK